MYHEIKLKSQKREPRCEVLAKCETRPKVPCLPRLVSSRPSSWRCRFNAGSSRMASRGRDACSRASICLSLAKQQKSAAFNAGALWCSAYYGPPEDLVFNLSICTLSNYRTSFLPFYSRVWCHTQWVASLRLGRFKKISPSSRLYLMMVWQKMAQEPITGHWSSPRQPSLDLLDTKMGKEVDAVLFPFYDPVSHGFRKFSQ